MEEETMEWRCTMEEEAMEEETMVKETMEEEAMVEETMEQEAIVEDTMEEEEAMDEEVLTQEAVQEERHACKERAFGQRHRRMCIHTNMILKQTTKVIATTQILIVKLPLVK